jgi:hypothetical protein
LLKVTNLIARWAITIVKKTLLSDKRIRTKVLQLLALRNPSLKAGVLKSHNTWASRLNGGQAALNLII